MVRSINFLRGQPHFFFLDFKNMATKGASTISGGKYPLIQHGYLHDFRTEK